MKVPDFCLSYSAISSSVFASPQARCYTLKAFVFSYNTGIKYHDTVKYETVLVYCICIVVFRF
ncbi:hypothetical protein Pint_19288 [Pistacia integerrima]|uniref:Uncharacterized protein n=1 Tax=Pistacia integerrima TaxID=434235 RepID=A0ACC0YWX5_9ROSI|nr:hypothetical protein Pint_19288 [Pistacia integerrima]